MPDGLFGGSYITATPNTPQDDITGAIASLYGKFGYDPRDAYQHAKRVTGLLGWAPGIGGALGGASGGVLGAQGIQEMNAGHSVLGAAHLAGGIGLAGLSLLPFGGKIAPEVETGLRNAATDLRQAIPQAAEAAPMRPSLNLVVARKYPDGTVTYGRPGQVHSALEGEDEMAPDEQLGFARGEGQPFLSREDAKALLKAEDAKTDSLVDQEQKATLPYLDAGDLNNAMWKRYGAWRFPSYNGEPIEGMSPASWNEFYRK